MSRFERVGTVNVNFGSTCWLRGLIVRGKRGEPLERDGLVDSTDALFRAGAERARALVYSLWLFWGCCCCC